MLDGTQDTLTPEGLDAALSPTVPANPPLDVTPTVDVDD
jgi:hypothetical protein